MKHLEDFEISKLVLKNLLLRELEDGSEQYNPDDNVQTPFERDPMGFILKKYTTLNDVLTELMTEDFEQYLDAIFIVAPKPTTFKIHLHNGQFFFLTFMGKAYQATIQGKDYYLMSIGEKERCMQAIARLLRYGSPLNTKGPEGAEQATRSEGEETGGEGGGENTGMEGDWAEKTGNVPAGGGETGEEEEETVSESVVLVEVLKKSIEEDKKTKSKDSPIFVAIFNELEKNNADPNRSTKYGALQIRASFDGEEMFIEKILKNLGLKSTDYKIKLVPRDSKESLSGRFPTYSIKFTKDSKIKDGIPVQKNDFIYLLNARSETKSGGKSTITPKALSPTNLGLTGKYKSLNELVNKTKAAIKNKNTHSNFLNSIVDDVVNGVSSKVSDLSKVENSKKEIKYSQESIAASKSISPSDLAIIGKDFGEILGGVYLAKLVGIKQELYYPEEGNYPLVDFFIDGYKISSKYDEGAAASITDLVKKIDPKRITDKQELDFFKTMAEYITNTGPQAYINVAIRQSKNMPAIKILAKILKLDLESITPQAINEDLFVITKGKNNKQKIQIIEKKYGEFFDATGTRPSILKNPKSLDAEWNKVDPKKIYGLITSPLSYYVVDQLNKNQVYLDNLKKLVARTEVKQMYLIFTPKSSSMSFNIKSFNDPNSSFIFKVPSISAYHPTASKLGFKLK